MTLGCRRKKGASYLASTKKETFFEHMTDFVWLGPLNMSDRVFLVQVQSIRLLDYAIDRHDV